MVWVLVAFEIVVVAGIVAVAWVIAKNGEHPARTMSLGVAVAVAAFAATGVLSLASINYRWPTGWIVAVAVALVALVAMVFLLGRDTGWKPIRVLGLVGLLALGSLGFGTLMSAGGGLVASKLQPLYVERVRQIARANGFVALMPRGEDLPTDMLPVEATPDGGLALYYSGFEVWEHKELATITEADLRTLVSPGATPIRDVVVPGDARIATLTVQGGPAVVAVFEYTPGASVAKEGAKAQSTTMLVTVADGVELRFWALGSERLVDGEWKKLGAMSPAELAEIAETMEPVE